MTSRQRLLAGLGAVALVIVGSLVAVQVSADPEPIEVTARIDVSEADPALVQGDWPVATTALPNLDPESGLGVSGPFGPPWPTEFVVGDAIVDEVALYQSPGVPVPTARTLPNPTVEGYRLVVLVRETQGEWLQVQINQRPNGATAWIRAEDVELRTVPHHIRVELGNRRLIVFQGDEEVFSTDMAPGRPETPTPTGAFYVDILTKPIDPNGPYGLYQVSLTGFSEVYESFAGGNGQIAIHGTNRPELIGSPASAGCVRLSNDDVSVVVSLARQGTPVLIVD